mgnify:CR=1 FL=1
MKRKLAYLTAVLATAGLAACSAPSVHPRAFFIVYLSSLTGAASGCK